MLREGGIAEPKRPKLRQALCEVAQREELLLYNNAQASGARPAARYCRALFESLTAQYFNDEYRGRIIITDQIKESRVAPFWILCARLARYGAFA